MNKKSQKSWLENNILGLNIVTILLYIVGFLLFKNANFGDLINIIGFIYLMFITPLNILVILRWRFNDFIEYLLACLVIFFTIITPFWFTLNYITSLAFTQEFILVFNLLIFVIILIAQPATKKLSLNSYINKTKVKFLFTQSKQIIIKYWPLFLTLLLYTSMHLINYYFYLFMPEWDGYSKIIEITNATQTNTIVKTYRGFFTMNIALIANFTKISIYNIFTLWMIILQTTQILVLYQFTKLYKIKNKLHQFIILFVALAIPVMNMEIDTTRPQSVLLILLPIYIYFLYKAIKSTNPTRWAMTILIAICGLNYHEFFIFILFTQTILFGYFIFDELWLHKKDHRDKIIFILLSIVILLLFFLLNDYAKVLNIIGIKINSILTNITQTENWRWWFLDNYTVNNNGGNIGWPGPLGALKYYSYYLSPSIIFIFVSLIFFTLNKKVSLKNILLRITTPLLILLFIYAEVLPRLNYSYLPERVLLIIDLLLIPIVIIIYKLLQKNYSSQTVRIFMSILLVFNITGILGSFYIASQKKSLTSPNEFIASQWVKNNTPENSFFIAQAASAVTIKYFANRPVMKTPLDFFNGKEKSTLVIPQEFLPPMQQINKHIRLLQDQLRTTTILDDADIDKTISTLLSTKKRIAIIKKYPPIKENYYANPPIYAFYSMDKFKGLYAQREWWLKTNYYAAKIENLTKKYPLVYNKDGIYIWKIK